MIKLHPHALADVGSNWLAAVTWGLIRLVDMTESDAHGIGGIMAESAVITIVDEGFEPGALALLNSLERARYREAVVIYCRTSRIARSMEQAIMESKVNFKNVFVVNYHPNPKYRKEMSNLNIIWQAWEKIDVFAMALRDFDTVYYFDPDIVVTKPWHFYTFWKASGFPVVCEPTMFPMSAEHIKNRAFEIVINRMGLDFVVRDFYVNAGFISISRKERELIEVWRHMIDALSPHALAKIARETGHDLRGVVAWDDQEGLNAALRAVDVPVTILGPDEGMGFGSLRSVAMFHAAGMRKPWRGSALADALRGRPPAGVHRAFLDFLDGPIPVLSWWRRHLRKADYWAARAVSAAFKTT